MYILEDVLAKCLKTLNWPARGRVGENPSIT